MSVLVEQGLVGLSPVPGHVASAYRAVRRLPLVERRFGLVLLATLVVAMLPLTWEGPQARLVHSGGTGGAVPGDPGRGRRQPDGPI